MLGLGQRRLRFVGRLVGVDRLDQLALLVQLTALGQLLFAEAGTYYYMYDNGDYKLGFTNGDSAPWPLIW